MVQRAATGGIESAADSEDSWSRDESPKSSISGSSGDDDSQWRAVGVDPDDERAFHFKKIDLLPATLLLFSQHGYNCWTSRDGGGIAETSESDWDAIGVPRGEQQKLKHSLEVYHKDFNAYNQRYCLPPGHFDRGIPMAAPTVPTPFQGASMNKEEGIVVALFLLAIAIQGKFKRVLKVAFNPEMRGFTVKCLAMALVLVFLVGVVFPKISAAISALSVPAALSAPAATVVAASTACVDGDTEVLTADRKKVPIRYLEAGDYVLALRKRKYVCQKILKVTENQVPCAHVYHITFDNGMVVTATRNHTFYVAGKKWCAVQPETAEEMSARRLCRGDKVVNSLGEQVMVTKIQVVPGDAKMSVFNLLLDGSPTWFANGLLTRSGMKPEFDEKPR